MEGVRLRILPGGKPLLPSALRLCRVCCLQMGLVSQEPTLFATSIGANIAYGKPGATAAEIEAAAISANAHSFISALPHGSVTSLLSP